MMLDCSLTGRRARARRADGARAVQTVDGGVHAPLDADQVAAGDGAGQVGPAAGA